MNFGFRGLSHQGFDEWIAKAKAAASPLARDTYLELEKPSEAVPVRYYSTVENGLYDAILGMCVRQGQMCVTEMHHIDRSGGAGKDSEHNRPRLEYDSRRLQSGDEPSGATFPASGRAPKSENQPEGMTPGGPEGTRPDKSQEGVPPANGGPAPSQLNQPAPRHQH